MRSTFKLAPHSTLYPQGSKPPDDQNRGRHRRNAVRGRCGGFLAPESRWRGL